MPKSTEKLQKAAVSGMVFRFAERILAQLVSTVVTIILARILLPEDYGVVSLVTIFITICNVFVSRGLCSALVQKKNADQLDFSTIFWAGFALSLCLYGAVFFAAPLIADFYDNPLITPVLRVMALKLPIAAFNSVQSAYVSKNFLFKKFFFATLIGTVTSGVVGIAMAVHGFGVWALAAQYLINSAMDTFFLFVTVKWRPHLLFSLQRFKALFDFGWKVLISALINVLYDELRSLLIGKVHSTADLSYFTKGKSFPQLIGNNVSESIASVMFPVFSHCQDDMTLLKNANRRAVKVSCYILCPLLIGFAAVAETFVRLVLTDKWLPSVPFLQVFSLMFLFKPITNINIATMKALKRSDLVLYGMIADKAVGVVLVLLFFRKQPIYLAWSALLSYFIGMIINSKLSGRLIRYRFKERIADTIPFALLALAACLPAWFLNALSINLAVKLALQVLLAAGVYLGASAAFKLPEYRYILQTGKKMLSGRGKRGGESANEKEKEN